MDSPRSGFRRAAVTSWALAGIGIAGVAGASALAYGDTIKPAAAELPQVEPAAATDPAATDPAVNLPPAPPVVDPAPAPIPPPEAPAPPSPEPTVTQAPAETYTPEPTYTQKPAYTPKPTAQAPAPAPAPATKSQPAFPIRQSHVPAGGGGTSGGNSFSPHVTVSRGS
ncbi:hypothetical protein H7J51_20375 [Mycobacterium crocinum]|uniref:Uncharacterized protein n=1 Tax=Mycolicibacterium crocinum TaxID=388459 RepID=A0ABY3TMC1_9MYCO|nr:hypothetical protein [Mycolicibacterium crocinum]MCV7217637.1 hypothetical protein [Mycolicibacterium crocinum]ULN42511.1 hypothetical protein MI149_05165 [Mycolicibacterium crocinum]